MRTTPATLAHVWAHYVRKSIHPREREYRLILALLREGGVVAVIDRGEPIALGGTVLDDGCPERRVWLSIVPGIADRILPAALIGRRLVREWARGHAAGLVTCVEDRNEEGRRLATLLGFVPTDVAGTDLRLWRYAHGGRRRDDLRQGGEAAGEHGGGGAGRPGGQAPV